jgi:alpha-L-fucosidase
MNNPLSSPAGIGLLPISLCRNILISSLAALCTTHAVLAQNPGPSAAPASIPLPARAPETPAAHNARMAWWRDAKFGMFIHWGLYAIPADGEWHMRQHKMPLAEYKKYAPQFNPVKFNADEWASVAQDAGMKYMVLTTKHHDGFAMFHSAASDYNIYDATPFKRDPLKELSEACPKHGIKLGTYYSVIADWGHPGGGAGCPKWDPAQVGSLDDYINKISIPQVKELLSNYGPIAVMWFDSDGAQPATLEQASRYAPVLNLQPNIIVDPRLHGIPGDFETCEGHIPMDAPAGDWELCDRTNGSWGYTHAPARPLESLLHELIEAWGKGGNVLLNVGPTEEGVIPPDSVARLRQIGSWLKVNGEAVYGSKRGPFDYLPWGWTTLKGDMLYLFVFDWPADGQLRLPMDTAVDHAWLVAAPDKSLPVTSADGKTMFKLPASAPDPIASVVAVKLKGNVTPYRSLTFDKPVTASDNQRSAGATLNGGAGGDWRIPGQTGALQVDMGKPEVFSVMRLTAPYTSASRILLEVKSGDQWKTIYEDDKPKGTEWVKTFPPVTGETVRLTIDAAKPGIRVGTFELFPPL